MGETSLDRIACGLGGKAVLGPFLQIASRLLQDGAFFLIVSNLHTMKRHLSYYQRLYDQRLQFPERNAKKPGLCLTYYDVMSRHCDQLRLTAFFYVNAWLILFLYRWDLFAGENWKSRHAGIMGLSTVGEGCRNKMEPIIEEVVNNIIPFLNDPVSLLRILVVFATAHK